MFRHSVLDSGSGLRVLFWILVLVCVFWLADADFVDLSSVYYFPRCPVMPKIIMYF